LINIATTTFLGHESLINGVPENQPRYNVDMPKIFIAINQKIATKISNIVVNINKATTKVEVKTSTLINILTQQTMLFDNLFSLPHLLARKPMAKNH